MKGPEGSQPSSGTADNKVDRARSAVGTPVTATVETVIIAAAEAAEMVGSAGARTPVLPEGGAAPPDSGARESRRNEASRKGKAAGRDDENRPPEIASVGDDVSVGGAERRDRCCLGENPAASAIRPGATSAAGATGASTTAAAAAAAAVAAAAVAAAAAAVGHDRRGIYTPDESRMSISQ